MAMPEITLELAPQAEPEITTTPVAPADNSRTEITEMEAAFSEKELAQIEAFTKQIDVSDSGLVLQYGAGAQKKIAAFSDTTLERVRTRDLGDAGGMLTDLIGELEDFSPDTAKFNNASLRKLKKLVSGLRTQYSKVSTNVERIVGHLEEHQLTLMQDLKMLDELYLHNQHYFKELSMYILAGKKRLEELRTTRLEELRIAAQNTSDHQAAMEYKDFADALERFDKKLHDLMLSRTVAMQMASQIRLLQGNDSLLIDKIQSTVVNTIPLWKSQMVIALGLANSMNAMRAQRSVTNMTNNLLRKNAENLKTGTIDVAREAERGIIDIETLVETNQKLIDTITEVQQIQADGREKRHSAEAELQLLERDLKNKLLQM
ncbi:MAG: toxic anion resistance protein [Clostridia bacterium]|nr:toxic anion resistance protein [Clostridia bacterium]